jgi:hypothetical protein
MQMKHLGLIALLTGCGPADQPTSQDNGTAFDQKSVMNGLTVIPIELLEDSRCPANADCAWPGQVRISAKWMREQDNGTVELTSGYPTTVSNGNLTLIKVSPVRATTEKIERGSYRFEFDFVDRKVN